MRVYVLVHDEYSDNGVVGVFDESCASELLKRFPHDDQRAFGIYHLIPIAMNIGVEHIKKGLFCYRVTMGYVDGEHVTVTEWYEDDMPYVAQVSLYQQHTFNVGNPGYPTDPMRAMMEIWPIWAHDEIEAIAQAEIMRSSYKLTAGHQDEAVSK